MLRYSAFIFCLTIVHSVWAGTYDVPEDNPIATIGVPDKWKTQEHEESIETVSPDGTAHAMVLPVEEKKVAECMGEAMRHIRRHGGITVKAKGIEGTARVKKREVPTVSWDATDHGRPMKIRFYVFAGSDERRIIFVTWGVDQEEKKNRAELTRILETIRTH